MRKRRDDDPGKHGRERRAQANHRRRVESGLGDVKTGGWPFFRDEFGGGPECYLDGIGHVGGAKLNRALFTEPENLAGDAKGKGASGDHREAESTDAPEGTAAKRLFGVSDFRYYALADGISEVCARSPRRSVPGAPPDPPQLSLALP